MMIDVTTIKPGYHTMQTEFTFRNHWTYFNRDGWWNFNLFVFTIERTRILDYLEITLIVLNFSFRLTFYFGENVSLASTVSEACADAMAGDHGEPEQETSRGGAAAIAVTLALVMVIVLIASMIASNALGATINFTRNDPGRLTAIEDMSRSGPYETGWSDAPAGVNEYDHWGRPAGSFEDAGMGAITLNFAADVKRAVVKLFDVGDTKWFKRLTGKTGNDRAFWHEIGENGNVLYSVIDFDEDDARSVKFRTIQVRGYAPGRQDGYSACGRK